ncbi:hypothetical protein L7F22_066774 [Adiantum nelumboides]|nr:hypothetical protein [Adiantum nelumboides]
MATYWACHAASTSWITCVWPGQSGSSSKVAAPNLKVREAQRKRVHRLSSLHSFHALASKAKRFCELGQLDLAFDILCQLDEVGYAPSHSLYWSLLNLCKKKKALYHASHLHSRMESLVLDPSNYFLAEYLVSTLVCCFALDAALEVFHKLPHKTTYSWTALINGHVEFGDAPEALKLYSLMLEEGFQPDEFTCVSLLKACTITSNLEVGKCIHDYARQNGYHYNIFVSCALITMYGECESMADAEDVFATIPHRSVVAWTSLLAGYVKNGQERKALQLYRQMREECLILDEQSFVVALQACCLIADKEKGTVIVEGKLRKVIALEIGEALHADAQRKGFDSGVYIANVLVLMYGKCGDISGAENVFCGIIKKNVPLWNAMLSAYTEQGHPDRALQLFKCMHEEGLSPEERSYVISLQACSLFAEKEVAVRVGKSLLKLKSLNIGKALHSDGKKKDYDSNLYISSALTNMYGKCGDLTAAKRLFDGLSQYSIVTWNAMLSAYVESGQGGNALELYQQMQAEGVGVDDVTLKSLLRLRQTAKTGGEIL